MAECKVVRAGETVSGKQGLLYAHGISSETAESRGLCMHRLTIPAGRYGLAHLHEAHESAIFVLEGEAEFWWGERLEHHESAGPATSSSSRPASRTCRPI